MGLIGESAGADDAGRHRHRRTRSLALDDAGENVVQRIDNLTGIGRAEVGTATGQRAMPGIVDTRRIEIAGTRPNNRRGRTRADLAEGFRRVGKTTVDAETDEKLHDMLPIGRIVVGVPVNFRNRAQIAHGAHVLHCAGHTGRAVREIHRDLVVEVRAQIGGPIVKCEIRIAGNTVHIAIASLLPTARFLCPDVAGVHTITACTGRKRLSVRQRLVGLDRIRASRAIRRMRGLIPVAVRHQHVKILAAHQISAASRVPVGIQRTTTGAPEELSGADHGTQRGRISGVGGRI